MPSFKPVVSARLVKKVLGVGGARAGTVVAGALSVFVLALLMGASEFGEYMACLTVGIFAAQISKWGLDGVATRHMPRFAELGAPGLQSAYAVWSNRVVVVRGAAVCAVGALIGVAADQLGFDNLLLRLAPYSAALALPTAISYLNQGILRGLGQQQLAELGEGTVKPVLTVGAVAVLRLVSKESPDFPAVFTIAVAVSGIVAGVSSILVFSKLRPSRRTSSKEDRAKWLRESLKHGAMNMAQLMFARTPMLVAGVVFTTAEIAVVAVAFRISDLVQFGVVSLGLSVAPDISTLHLRGDRGALRQLFRRCQVASIAMSIAGAVAIVLLMGFFLDQLGPEYRAARGLIHIALAAQILAAAFGPVGYFVSMLGKQASAAGTQVVLAAVMIPGLVLAYNVGGAEAYSLCYGAFCALTAALLYLIARADFHVEPAKAWPAKPAQQQIQASE